MHPSKVLPVIPLRNAVLFPGVSFPIAAGRPGTLHAIETAMKSPEQLVFAVTQRQDLEAVTPELLHTVGTIASIGPIQRGVGGARLLLQGKARGIAMRIEEKEGRLEAVVVEAEEMPPLDSADTAFVALLKELRERSAELAKKLGLPDEAVGNVLTEADDPGRLADLVAGYIDIPTAERQLLLETLPVEDRVRRTLVHVQRQIDVLDAQEEIKSKVQEELGDRQREMFLRQQLKAIQKELGEGEDDGDDLKGLKEKLDALVLTEEVRKEIDREWKKLQRLSRESMEAQVVRNYLELVAELPWSARSEEHLDVVEAQRILDEDHYALKDVKDRILEFLAVRQLLGRKTEAAAAPSADGAPADAPAGAGVPAPTPAGEKQPNRGRILLFAGPPGVGKTSIAKSIARALGRKYVRISLGGARDEADIRGHRRTYVGAMPGRILQGMRQAGTKNPVFLLDEVDKLGVSFQGDPASALLEVLDPAQNDSFTDHYLNVPFDLSEVLFVATANFVQSIPGPLLDRLEVIEFSGYTEREKTLIARNYLLPRQLSENGLGAGQLEVTDAALAEIISSYTREAGVRQLERELGKLGRKVARRIAAGEIEKAAVDAADVAPILGRKKIQPEKIVHEDQVGVATGMYYTPAGGDIMFIEAALMRGKGEVLLTGQLGDVMKESARAAWTFARSHAALLGIDDTSFERDLHIHVPAGAIPKDGPSAGVAMASALVSALSKRPCRRDVAMTGEVTLSGRVLPIGGVKEKLLGAVRAGIRTVVLPKENVPDLEDLPQDVRDGLEIVPVQDLSEALAVSLRGRVSGGQLKFAEEPAGTGTGAPPTH
ncbi:MAG TPA: endopeptidase La [Thermoanaerobaculia bacterium]|nr:endopeptidase La [Thermoanaerobaculia bacterium]HQN07994.1 endopeptidase La [Thermoanaerobaculia bacterium]HQP85610.1 endopeptidase La [Thermoanaerobaculia bacterium]